MIQPNRPLLVLALATSLCGCSVPAPLAAGLMPSINQATSHRQTRTALTVTSQTAWPNGLDTVQKDEQTAFVTWAQQANPGIIAMAFQTGTPQRSIQRLAVGDRTLGFFVSVTGTASEVDEFGQMEAAFVQGFLYDDALQPLVWMGAAYDVNEAQPPKRWTRWRRTSRGGFVVIGSADVPEVLADAKRRSQQRHAAWLQKAYANLDFKPVTSQDPVPCIALQLDGAPIGWFTTAHTQGFQGSRIAAGFAFADWLATDGSTVAETVASLNPFKPAQSAFLPLQPAIAQR
jgi:hypothetical protein